jgi:hypothetical protein
MKWYRVELSEQERTALLALIRRGKAAARKVRRAHVFLLASQCLDRRIGDAATLKGEVRAWKERRNRAGTIIQWLFNLADARTKLKHLYPSSS